MNLAIVSFFLADLKIRCFKLVVFYIIATNHSTSLRKNFAKVPFREEFSFQGKEKVSAILANSTPVFRKIECQKTFGEGPRSVCNTIHAFQNSNTCIGYTSSCEKSFNANES